MSETLGVGFNGTVDSIMAVVVLMMPGKSNGGMLVLDPRVDGEASCVAR